MAQKNNSLHAAKVAKNDEFYTTLSDIEKEVIPYGREGYFKDKVVYCNCDDAKQSNFFRLFSKKFMDFGMKKLITTSYNENGHGTMLVYEGDKNGNRQVDDDEIITTELEGNGDFRSDECIELLKEADIVVTNPPFSKFISYITLLVEYDKKFLIIGNKNAITYKEVFPLIKENKLWLGVNDVKNFIVPLDKVENPKTQFEKDGKIYQKFGNIGWFTNLENKKRNRELCLWKKYNPKDFPKYDNYDAINVDKVIEIPEDYDGVMGVPITFLDKYCPKQFEIVAFRKGADGKDLVYTRERERENPTLFSDTYPPMPIDGLMQSPKDTKVNGKSKYARILIQKIKKYV